MWWYDTLQLLILRPILINKNVLFTTTNSLPHNLMPILHSYIPLMISHLIIQVLLYNTPLHHKEPRVDEVKGSGQEVVLLVHVVPVLVFWLLVLFVVDIQGYSCSGDAWFGRV